MQIQSRIYDLDLSLWMVKVRQAGDVVMIPDRDIPDLLRSAIEKVLDPDQIGAGIRKLNDIHVAVYEACQVSRDLELVIAHEIYVISRTSDLSSIQNEGGKKDTILKTINSLRELTQNHIEYHS